MNQSDTWFDGVARNLVRHAARKAPLALSERLGEEWLADLRARSGGWSQLRFALGCCWATTVIANEFGAPVGAAAAAVIKTTLVRHAESAPGFSRRGTVIVVIVGLHVLVVCVLATAIEAPNVFKASPARIDVSFLPKPAAPVPPTPADPTPAKVWHDPPPPQGPTIPTEQTVTPADQIPEVQPARSAGSALPKSVNRVLGGPGAGFPNPDDFYPEGAIRLREKGLAMVNVCVDGSGQLIARPTIEQSSGSARLDGAALKLARAGSGHYRPTTEDGRAVSACYPLRVRFQFRD